MNIFAISDTHFGHDKLVELSGRPKNFSELILNNLRNQSGDVLIHCGDFCIGHDEGWTADFMIVTSKFNKKILVRGNHDSRSDAWYYRNGWDFVCESFAHTYFGKKTVFTHVPIVKTDEFAINVHGHLHGNGHHFVEYYDNLWHYDLAPEVSNYKATNVLKI
jgi:calcineurin-like phosphoesterase family protein